MPITHYWDGTKLVVTSDSGTSSADLKGEIGIRGPQGPAGFLVDREGVEIDSKDLALKSEIPTIVANPSEDATTQLTKLTIADTVYSLPNGDVVAAGDNTFTGANSFTGNRVYFGAGISMPGTDDFLVNGSYNISLPSKSGTVALLNDITSAINNAVISVINTEA